MGNVMHGAREGILSRAFGFFRLKPVKRKPVEVHHVRYVNVDLKALQAATHAKLWRELGRGK